jgi:hypothetical protein
MISVLWIDGSRRARASKPLFTNPQSLNRYAYVMNNPTTLTDPLGLYHDDGNGNIVGDYDGEVMCDDSGTCYVWSAGAGMWSPDPNPTTDPAFGADQGSGGWGGWGSFGTALGNFGSAVGNTLTAIKNKVCSALPQGRTVGASGGIGGAGNVSGSLELVINYGSGQISGFASLGVGTGWLAQALLFQACVSQMMYASGPGSDCHPRRSISRIGLPARLQNRQEAMVNWHGS